MGKFRKKPVVIEAIQFDGSHGSADEIVTWSSGLVAKAFDPRGYLGFLTIQTLEGRMEAIGGDWIIRGIKGEYYPCKTDIFQATYEAVP